LASIVKPIPLLSHGRLSPPLCLRSFEVSFVLVLFHLNDPGSSFRFRGVPPPSFFHSITIERRCFFVFPSLSEFCYLLSSRPPHILAISVPFPLPPVTTGCIGCSLFFHIRGAILLIFSCRFLSPLFPFEGNRSCFFSSLGTNHSPRFLAHNREPIVSAFVRLLLERSKNSHLLLFFFLRCFSRKLFREKPLFCAFVTFRF